jgi:DNA (cytosine-5)-methyltransferase 1
MVLKKSRFNISHRDNEPIIYLIDLFAGAGGTATAANFSSNRIRVIYCINHDPIAIRSHSDNHPDCIHSTEDIRYANLKEIKEIVDKLRKDNPNCKIAIWASLECTHFSKAKGGQSRDGDSRSLAEAMYRYESVIKPDFFWYENVREFLTWGPIRIKEGKTSTELYSSLEVDSKGLFVMIPDKTRKCESYNKWVNEFKRRGFSYDYRLLNSADYGGYTIRTRYFGQFSKDSDLIAWPKQTHAKKADPGKGLKQYKAVKDVLDLEDHGRSIFRKKPLSDKTYERIYAGLLKFVANGNETFIAKYFSGRPEGKVIPLSGPAGTIKTVDGHSVIFTYRYNGGNPEDKVKSIDLPIGTITTNNRHALTSCQFLTAYYGTTTLGDIEKPCGTLTTKDRYNKIEVQFIDQQFGQSKPIGIYVPSNTLTSTPKYNLITTESTQYLMNPQYSSKGSSIDAPCFTLIARTDKSPPYLITTERESYEFGIIIYDHDSEIVKKIKAFMAEYGISDIKQRMFKIMEMKKIQGFPENYILHGTQQDQKRGIGNSVEVTVGKALFKAITFNFRLKHNSNPNWKLVS